MRSLEEILLESIAVKERILRDDALRDAGRAVAEAMIATYRAGGRTYFCGNGGSAADAQHFAAELSGHLVFDRPPLGAEALHGNTSHLTAVANDYDYESAFARALEGSVKSIDTVVCISTSGNSPSILRVAEMGRAKGATVVGMTGESGGELRDRVDLLINVPSSDVGRIQESHIVFVHSISEHVEHAIFGHLRDSGGHS